MPPLGFLPAVDSGVRPGGRFTGFSAIAEACSASNGCPFPMIREGTIIIFLLGPLGFFFFFFFWGVG